MPLIGEKLKDVQRKLGLTQRQLAEKTGVHFKSVNNYVTGRTTPDAIFMERLCKQLNISPGWLLLGEGEMLAEGSGYGAVLPTKSKFAVIRAYAWLGQSKKDMIRKSFSALLWLERSDRFDKLYEQIGPKKLTAKLTDQLGAVSRKKELLEWEALVACCAYQMIKISEQYGEKSEMLNHIAHSGRNGSWSSIKLFKIFRSSHLKFAKYWRGVLEMKEFQ